MFMILEFMFYWVCYFILKLVYFVVVNVSYNMGFSEVNLVISKVEVNGGIIVKKLKFWVWGCSFLIKRLICYIIIVMKDIFLDDEYVEMYLLKKMRWKKKFIVMLYGDMYNSGGLWDKK